VEGGTSTVDEIILQDMLLVYHALGRGAMKGEYDGHLWLMFMFVENQSCSAPS
jgi:hypothetical protein